jgi:hypothetical protein
MPEIHYSGSIVVWGEMKMDKKIQKKLVGLEYAENIVVPILHQQNIEKT